MDERASCLVVVGGSAGGVEALATLAAGLPADLDAAVCVVLHLHSRAESRLAHIVSRAGLLPATQARGGELLQSGWIHVAPPNRHLSVDGSRLCLDDRPRENGFRPSIDVLFRSAAQAYGPRTVAVVLSGARDDGVAGASAVGARGGCVFVQDPADARLAALPSHTVSRDDPDRVLPVGELASAVTAVVERRCEEGMSDNARGDER